MARQHEESVAQFQKALDLNPNLPVVRAMLALAYAMKRMYPQDLAEYDKIADQDNSRQPVRCWLAWLALCRLGQAD